MYQSAQVNSKRNNIIAITIEVKFSIDFSFVVGSVRRFFHQNIEAPS